MFVQSIQSKRILFALAGAFLGFCFSSLHLYIVSLLPLAFYFYTMSKKCSIKESLGNQFVFIFFMHLTCLSFIWGMYPFEFLDISKGTAFLFLLFGWLGLSALMSLFYLLIPLLSQLIDVSERQRGLVIVILWTLIESFFELLGFPWIRMGIFTLVSTMFSYVGSIGSVFVCTLFWLALACILSWLDFKKVALFLVLWCLPSFLVNYKIVDTSKVALIQGNISSQDKWDRDTFDLNEEIHSNLINSVGEDVDAIFMAETVFTDSIYKSNSLYQSFTKPTLFGAFTIEKDSTYNSLCSSLNDTCYYKRELVPFGEYMPRWASNLLPFLNEFQLAGNLSSGSENVILESSIGEISPLLCFESIFPYLIEGGKIIYLASNDSWFDGSNEQFQHLQHARMRSIEQGKDMIRVGNTGGTCLIDASGTIRECLPSYTSGVLEGNVRIYEKSSVFARFPFVAMILKLMCSLYVGYILFKHFDSNKWIEFKLMMYVKR